MILNLNKINETLMWSDIIGVTLSHTDSMKIREVYFYSYDNIENLLKMKIIYNNNEEELFELNVINEENTKMIMKYKLDIDLNIITKIKNVSGDTYLASFITKLINDGYTNYDDLTEEIVNSINILYNTDITSCKGMTLIEMQNMFYQL